MYIYYIYIYIYIYVYVYTNANYNNITNQRHILVKTYYIQS